ncbi:MAG: hypothetical protein CBC72_001325 [Gammaproteobacteria bacterium TMED112]|nr:MAG: hypothetical protein CBC72_001325 [Gammaproteobacteria bacterium TMED112]
MVEPEVFFMNPETASSNHYQADDNSISTDEILKLAKREFTTFKNALTKNGVDVLSMKGSTVCPDHVFPNWFITFEDKTFQIFSMLAENRRKEKTPEMIEKLSKEYKLTHDLSFHEDRNIFLESTSSMVFDRVNRVVYLTISPRANAGLANEWCNENNYELVMFETESHTGSPVYHTDVLMFVGTSVIGICYEVIKPEYRNYVKERVERHHEVIEIKKEQLLSFCGNCLEIADKDGNLMLVMSTAGFNGYTTLQKNKIKKHFKKIIHSDIQTIEKYGGGSARCMLAELF